MLKRFKTNLFLSLILTGTALAASTPCPNQNLYKIPDSPYNKIPVYDQDSVGICYAYTAADMANFSLISSKKENGVVVDPVWVAYIYSTSKKQDSLEIGNTPNALRALSQKGICRADAVAKLMEDFSKSTGLSEPRIITFLNDLEAAFLDLHQKQKNGEGTIPTDKIFSQAFHETAEQYKVFQNLDQASCEKRDLFEENLKQIDFLTKNTLDISREYIFQKNCRGSDLIKNYKFKPETFQPKFSTDEDFSQKIRQLMTNHAQPLGIRYCYQVLEDKNYDGLKGKERDDTEDDCGRHASVLVGSRSQNNQCQYLLRNTYGNQWGDWSNNQVCFCQNKKTNEYVEDCTKEKNPSIDFSVLGCWIPEDILAKNIYGVNWIKN